MNYGVQNGSKLCISVLARTFRGRARNVLLERARTIRDRARNTVLEHERACSSTNVRAMARNFVLEQKCKVSTPLVHHNKHGVRNWFQHVCIQQITFFIKFCPKSTYLKGCRRHFHERHMYRRIYGRLIYRNKVKYQYLEVDGIFLQVQIPEVQINVHFG